MVAKPKVDKVIDAFKKVLAQTRQPKPPPPPPPKPAGS